MRWYDIMQTYTINCFVRRNTEYSNTSRSGQFVSYHFIFLFVCCLLGSSAVRCCVHPQERPVQFCLLISVVSSSFLRLWYWAQPSGLGKRLEQWMEIQGMLPVNACNAMAWLHCKNTWSPGELLWRQELGISTEGACSKSLPCLSCSSVLVALWRGSQAKKRQEKTDLAGANQLYQRPNSSCWE